MGQNVYPGKTLGHVALNYRPGDGLRAARLFELIGCQVTDTGMRIEGNPFYVVRIDDRAPNPSDSILFLGVAAQQQLAFEAAAEKALGIGTAAEDPAVAQYRADRDAEPELLGTHFGIRYDALEAMEAAVAAVQAECRRDAGFGDRVQIHLLRAKRGVEAAIDARMDTSPIFAAADRSCFVDYGVQAFLRTDLVAGSLFTFGHTIELDYVFVAQAAGEAERAVAERFAVEA